MNNQIKDIGMRLACLREDVEISTSEMAKKLGVDEETYIAYEKGEMTSHSASYTTPQKYLALTCLTL